MLYQDPVRVGDFVVEGDGTPTGTTVLYRGQPVMGVQRVTWELGIKDKSTLTITVIDTRPTP